MTATVHALGSATAAHGVAGTGAGVVELPAARKRPLLDPDGCDDRGILAWYERQMKLDDKAREFAKLVINRKLLWTMAGAAFEGGLRLDGQAAKARQKTPEDVSTCERLAALALKAHQDARKYAGQADALRYELGLLRPDYDAGMGEVASVESSYYLELEHDTFRIPSDLDAAEVALFSAAIIARLQSNCIERGDAMVELVQADALRAAQARLWMELQQAVSAESDERFDVERLEKGSMGGRRSVPEGDVDSARLAYLKATETRPARPAALVRVEIELARLLHKSMRQIAAMRTPTSLEEEDDQ